MESTGDAGDQYTGLDRFGRVVDQRWIDTSTDTDLDRFFYTYDRNSNRTSKLNALLTEVGSNPLTFDANGNMTTDETGRQFVSKLIMGVPPRGVRCGRDDAG